MAGNDDIIRAFDSLVQGVRSYNISRTLGDAQKSIEEVQSTIPDEFKQREAQQKIAQATAARIGQLGGNASQMAQAMASFAPQAINTQEASLEATGASTVAGAVKTREQQAQTKADNASQRDFLEKQKLLQMQLDAQKEIAGMKTGKVKELPKPLQAQFDEFDKTDVELNSLIDRMKNDPNAAIGTGPLAQFVPSMVLGAIPGKDSGEVAAFRAQTNQFFNQYRKIITGAGASNAELEDLRKSTPTGADTPDQFVAKAERARDIAKSVMQRYASRRIKQGYDLTGYDDLLVGGTKPVDDNRAPASTNSQGASTQKQSLGGFTFIPD